LWHGGLILYDFLWFYMLYSCFSNIYIIILIDFSICLCKAIETMSGTGWFSPKKA
jgi:hypothetical protein